MNVSLLLYSRSYRDDYRWIFAPSIGGDALSDLEKIYRCFDNRTKEWLFARARAYDPIFLMQTKVGICIASITAAPYRDRSSREVFALSGIYVENHLVKECWGIIHYLVSSMKSAIVNLNAFSPRELDGQTGRKQSVEIDVNQLREEYMKRMSIRPGELGGTRHSFSLSGFREFLARLSDPSVGPFEFFFGIPDVAELVFRPDYRVPLRRGMLSNEDAKHEDAKHEDAKDEDATDLVHGFGLWTEGALKGSSKGARSGKKFRIIEVTMLSEGFFPKKNRFAAVDILGQEEECFLPSEQFQDPNGEEAYRAFAGIVNSLKQVGYKVRPDRGRDWWSVRFEGPVATGSEDEAGGKRDELSCV